MLRLKQKLTYRRGRTGCWKRRFSSEEYGRDSNVRDNTIDRGCSDSVLGSEDSDEEEHASAVKARLPKDLQSLKLEESKIEDWDTPSTTDKKVRGNEGPPEKPQ